MNWLLIIALCLPLPALAQSADKAPTTLPQKKAPAPEMDDDDDDGQPTPQLVREQQPKQARRAQLNATNAIRLNYGLPDWNKSPTKIDAASLLMREGASGKIVQIYIEETEPDSSIFTGLYSINWQDVERLQVEFYVPPQELLSTPAGLKKVMSMITNQELKRHPFLVRRQPGGLQSVEIFDTKEQARAALATYRAEMQVTTQANKKLPTDDQVATAKLEQELKEKEAAAKAASDRLRLEQIAAREAAEALARQAALAAAEKAARIAQAVELAEAAMSDYRTGNSAAAKEKFDKALELDPSNKNYYFQFGVTLYKTGDYNRSLVFLKMAEGANVNPAEQALFIGLNHFRLKEYSNAVSSFDKVAVAKDAQLSPTAYFYKGVALFEQKNYADAQPAFQAVLDTSKDPALDQRAENYIELILRTQQFEAERGRNWQLSATIGEMYDTNVILSSDSDRDAGTATDIEGYRSLFQSSLRYRPVYDEKQELAIQVDFMGMFTLDKSFKTLQKLRNSDPYVYTITAPWSHKGLLFGKGHKLDIVPGYEGTWMSVEDDTNKEILTSYLLSVQNLLVMSNSWYANYNLELRQDNSKLTTSTGDDDSSATKVKIAFNNLFFVNPGKTKMVTAESAFTSNLAVGKNSRYHKLDLAAGWVQPFKWDTSVNAKLAYYMMTYPGKETVRTDHDITVSAGLSKKLSETYSTGFLANYTINNSTDEESTYKKWTAMLTFSALTGF